MCYDLYLTHINVCEQCTAQMMKRPAPASFAQFAAVLQADTCRAATGQKASINRLSSLIGLPGKYIDNK